MNDTIIGCRTSGDVLLHGKSINGKDVDVVELRARVGMVFQKANPFPKSIYDNVAYGPACTAWLKIAPLWMTLWNKAWVTPVFGKKSKKNCTPPARNYPAVNNNACVSPRHCRAPRSDFNG